MRKAPRAARILRLTLAAGLAALLIAPGARANNGISPLASGARAAGRGGTEVAIGGDVLTSTGNPATLSELEGARIDLTFGTLIERVRTSDPFSDELEVHGRDAPLLSLGFAWDPFAAPPRPGAPSPTPSRWRFGFTIWEPIGLVVAPTFSAAFQLTDTLAIGASLHGLVTYLNLTITAQSGGGAPGAEPDFLPRGVVRLHRRDGQPLDPPEPYDGGTGTPITWEEVFRIADGAGGGVDAKPTPTLELEIEKVFGAGLAGQVGLFWRPVPALSLGLSYRTPGVIFQPRGEGTVDLAPAIRNLKQDPDVAGLLDAAFDAYLPDGGRRGYRARYDLRSSNLELAGVLGAGVAWRPSPRVLLAADLRFHNWTGVTSKIELRGQHGDNRDFNEINGGPGIDYTIELDWRDQLVLGVGAAVAVTQRLALRAGYNYGNNPVSEEFLIGNSIATEHHFTAGASLSLGPWDLDVTYMYGVPTQVSYSGAQLRSTSEQHFVYLGLGYAF